MNLSIDLYQIMVYNDIAYKNSEKEIDFMKKLSV